MVQKATIICVDDEKTILDALKEQLNRYFKREYAIECAENGEKALELFNELREDQFDIPVIISDHIMPGMKGDELLKQIYRLDPRIKKILLTGQADADAVGRAVNSASLYRYIPKPWEQNDLALTIQEAIRSYYQDRTLEEQNDKLKLVNEDLTNLNLKLKQKIDLFNKFVPNQFLKIMQIDLEKKAIEQSLKTDEYIQLSQHAERELTVMFADIRSFTTICEGLTSLQAFDFVNSYLCEVGPVIAQHKGFIDKFIGDAIMALFTDADDAVQAAIAMQKQLTLFNRKLEKMGFKPIAIGIGINTDTVMLGTIGEENRLQTTVIGDAVNLSQRTEVKAKNFATKIVITENTLKKLGNPSAFKFRFIDRSTVKGKSQMVNFYEVLDIFPEEVMLKKWQISDLYEEGVKTFLKNDFKKAEEIFTECLIKYPDDYGAQQYLSEATKSLHVCQIAAPQAALSPAQQRYLKFWGTRGSTPVSGAEYLHYGGATSCLEFRDEDQVIIFDAGSGIRLLGEQLLKEKQRTIHLMISHFHWDHIWGFPFFLPIFNKDFHIHIYAPGGPEIIQKQLTTLLDPKFFPVSLTQLQATLTYHDLLPQEQISIGRARIHISPAYHPGKTVCYRVETPELTFGYATDNEFLLGRQGSPYELDLQDLKDEYGQINFFKGCDLFIHEAQYLPEDYKKKTGWGHSSIENALVLIRAIQPKKWVITHHDPDDTDPTLLQKREAVEKLLSEGNISCQVEIAFDGQVLSL